MTATPRRRMHERSTYYLRTHEVVRSLSLREFMMLCSLIDEFGPKSTMSYRHGSGSDVQTVDGILQMKKFRILRILRDMSHSKILIFVEHEALRFGATKRTWYEVAQDRKK